ncbi:hypothetical protein [Gorillibacterium sp. CAU 1737]|uniref:hypothetical protein n=1 Tax=Gorillibacterium sp. CAU 1737 TaxID=3140362 RepID=UPI003260F81F
MSDQSEAKTNANAAALNIRLKVAYNAFVQIASRSMQQNTIAKLLFPFTTLIRGD